MACNADYEFTNVVVKWPGSTHDSFILRNSRLWEDMEQNPLRGIILGDSAYPLRYWLMTPIQQPMDARQRLFNKCHSKTRVAIEQTIGQAKRRFNALHQENRRSMKNLSFDIMSCCILHNFAKRYGQPVFEGPDNAPWPQNDNDADGVNDEAGGSVRRTQITSSLWRRHHH